MSAFEAIITASYPDRLTVHGTLADGPALRRA
jgi:hypothetical protein